MRQKNKIKTAMTMQKGSWFDYNLWSSNVITGIESWLSERFDSSFQQSFTNVVFEQCIPSLGKFQQEGIRVGCRLLHWPPLNVSTGGSPSRGWFLFLVSIGGGLSVRRGGLPQEGGLPPQGGQPTPPLNRQTLLKTLPFLAVGNKTWFPNLST